jgi:hypothetical protein
MNEASEYYFSSRRYSNFAKNFVDVRTRCCDVFPSPGPIGYMLSKIPPACLSECVKPHHFSPCYLQRTQLERPTPTHSSIFTHTKFIPYLTCFPQHSLLWSSSSSSILVSSANLSKFVFGQAGHSEGEGFPI